MKRRLPFWIQFAVFAGLVACAALIWVRRDEASQLFASYTGQSGDKGKSKGGKGEKKVPVVIALVENVADNATIEAIGTGRARRFITLYPEVAEEIVDFPVRAGDRVKKGDIILRLDSRDAELALNVAKTKLMDAERTLERAEQLHSRNINSLAKVDDARTQMERAKLELHQAEEVLARHVMIAPFNGVVGIPKMESGDRVSASTAIITLDDRSELLVEFEVPELYLSRLKAGQKVVATTPSFGDRQFTGHIDQVDSRVDPVSRSVTARAAIPNQDDLLRPGMSFAVEVLLPGETYPTVPELAFLWGKGESYVWRIKQDKAEKITVRIVKRLNNKVLVEGDIAAGDFVVVEGVQRLRPGTPVTYTAPPPAVTSLNTGTGGENERTRQ